VAGGKEGGRPVTTSTFSFFSSLLDMNIFKKYDSDVEVPALVDMGLVLEGILLLTGRLFIPINKYANLHRFIYMSIYI
jgi:hypothetical protein